MVNKCIITGCGNKYGEGDIRLYRCPKVMKQPGRQGYKKSVRRRAAWLTAINRNIDHLSEVWVCSAHFLSGQPASHLDEGHVDWAPSLKLVPKSQRGVRHDTWKAKKLLASHVLSSTVNRHNDNCIASGREISSKPNEQCEEQQPIIMMIDETVDFDLVGRYVEQGSASYIQDHDYLCHSHQLVRGLEAVDPLKVSNSDSSLSSTEVASSTKMVVSQSPSGCGNRDCDLRFQELNARFKEQTEAFENCLIELNRCNWHWGKVPERGNSISERVDVSFR